MVCKGVSQVKVTSAEATYHTHIHQIFLEHLCETYEAILTIGYPEGQEADLDIKVKWENEPPYEISNTQLFKMIDEFYQKDEQE